MIDKYFNYLQDSLCVVMDEVMDDQIADIIDNFINEIITALNDNDLSKIKDIIFRVENISFPQYEGDRIVNDIIIESKKFLRCYKLSKL